MFLKSISLIFTLLFTSSSIHARSETSSPVVDLTVDDFQSTVDAHTLIMIQFMTPWCRYCKSLIPEYERAAKTLQSRNITLAKLDCSVPAEAELCQEQDVYQYPTLKIFQDRNGSDYNGPRKSDEIVKIMLKRSLPVVSIITSQNHTNFTQSSDVVAVAYLDQSDHENFQVFNSYAQSKRDNYVFGICHDHSLIKDLSTLPKPSLVVWKSFDEGRDDFQSPKFTIEDISRFVSSNAVPLFEELSPSNFDYYSSVQTPLAFMFIETTNPSRETLLETLKPLAREYKGKINFVWVDALKFGDHARSLNLPGTHWPEFVIQDFSTKSKFPLPPNKQVNYHNLAEFIKDFNQGQIKPTYKTQPIPLKQGPGSHVLVNSQFDEIVYENSKDVFIQIYAPWCGHCKRLKPIWDNLAHSFKDSTDKVLITKFDATENDLPPTSGIAVQGFPTLQFKKAGSKEFMDYEGNRTLDSLIEFVEKNSGNQVKAVKVEFTKDSEVTRDRTEQMVFNSEELEPVEDDYENHAEDDEDEDAEHDEL
ncbi:hypothetical protein O181_037594 [Austropuccinia psidii MF-1]|uniref:Protein disulfide-isomerase n=1 Tax=Austropuccinia psidii MF-1 TaxID=1389203 RepID=A0A9Q3D6V0_9BASI|nr:hypothetical protein [Austropuccinia psidii MF-1]